MKCVLFDLDGTIADTETLKARALALAIESFGGQSSPAIYKQVMGQSWENVTSAFFADAGVDVPLDKFDPVFREYYGHLVATELEDTRGASVFLPYLRLKGLKIGLVSSASPWMIQRTLAKLKLGPVFDVVVSNGDTDRHKPHPDAYILALSRVQIDAANAIAFEDSESGFWSLRTGAQVFC